MCLYGSKIDGMLRKIIVFGDTTQELTDSLELNIDAIRRYLRTVFGRNCLRDQSLNLKAIKRGMPT